MALASSLIPTARLVGMRAWLPTAPSQLGAALTLGSLAILWGLAGWLALHWIGLRLAIVVGTAVLSLGIAGLGMLLARAQRQAAADRQALYQARLRREP